MRRFCCALLIVISVLTFVRSMGYAAGQAESGKAIYTRLCAPCHGDDGGGGRMGAMLDVRPRNLADQGYMQTRSDQQLFDVIKQGGAAVGLSAAMSAFGTQLSEQDIWDAVAYIRTLSVTAEVPAGSAGTAAVRADAPAPDLAMARLRLSIWPEYDDPRVLIMWRGEMTPRSAFPTRLTIPLPKRVEIIGAGMISDKNELLTHPHQVIPGETQDTLELSLPGPRFFVEFYYDPSLAAGGEKRFTYTVPTTYPIELLEVDIQQPRQATDFQTTPPAMAQGTDQQGLTYHQIALRNVAKGQAQILTVSYTKTAADPSVPKQLPVPQAQAAPRRGERPQVHAGRVTLALSILAGVTALYISGAWLWVRRRQHRLTASSPTSTPLVMQEPPVSSVAVPSEAMEAMPGSVPTRAINFCANCGRKRQPDDRFCAGCGKPLQP